jgi:hypothetical protein
MTKRQPKGLQTPPFVPLKKVGDAISFDRTDGPHFKFYMKQD